MTKKIKVQIAFSQSKTYPTNWKIRYSYIDGYRQIFVYDEISKSTQFGENPNLENMKAYGEGQAVILISSFGCEAEVEFI